MAYTELRLYYIHVPPNDAQYVKTNIFLQVYKYYGIPFLSDSRKFNCQSLLPIYVVGIKRRTDKERLEN